MKKLLVLSGNVGSGHNSAANELKGYYESQGYEVHMWDFLEYVKLLGKVFMGVYELFLSNSPFLFEKIYDLIDKKLIARAFYSMRDFSLEKHFAQQFTTLNPDEVIIVFPYWYAFFKQYFKSHPKTFPLGVVITDSYKVINFRYTKRVPIDRYFVTDEHLREYLIKDFKYDPEKVLVTFFPLQSKHFITKTHIGSSSVIMLLTELPIKFCLDFLSGFQKTDKKIIVVKGRNDKVYHYLKKYVKAKNIEYKEYIDIKQALHSTDILISKPGGAITNECIATDTPLIAPYRIPSVEEGNAEMLAEYGIGIYETNPRKVLFLLQYIDWNKMLPNFQPLKKTDSCQRIFTEMKKVLVSRKT